MRQNRLLQGLFGLLAALCGFGIVTSAADQPERTIRIGILGSKEDEDYDGALVFKDFVESRTNGAVRVDIFTSGQFCSNQRECVANMQSGVLDVFMTTIGDMGTFFGPGQVFDLPYAFRDDRVAECVFDGPLMDDLRTAVLEADAGIRLMVVSNTGGWRNFATTRKQVKHPDDLRGLTIRTTSAPIQQELVRQLGANATPFAWSELYTGLATGAVEGTKNGVQDIVGMQFHEHLKFLVLDGHAYMGALWWFSDVNWQSLSDEERRIVFDGFQHLKTVTRALPMRRQLEAYEVFEEAGGVVYVPTTEEKAAFREATSGMRQWFAKRYGQGWIEKLDAAVATCEASLDAGFTAANDASRSSP